MVIQTDLEGGGGELPHLAHIAQDFARQSQFEHKYGWIEFGGCFSGKKELR